jgi:miniconductance mechanosensitive channel
MYIVPNNRPPMNRFPLQLLLTGLFAWIGMTGAAADEANGAVTEENRRILTIPALIRIGSAGDQVRELQASLNEQLSSRIIALPPGSEVGPILDSANAEITFRVRKLLLNDGRDLRIRADWKPCDQLGIFIDEELLPGLPDGPKYLSLPPEKPLKVDGVYGQHTYAAVLLFQLQMNLQPTGEVDAVTLDKLEPMIPSSWLLAGMMKWAKAVDLFSPENEHYALRIKRLTAFVTTVLILVACIILYQFACGLANAPKFLDKWFFTESSSPWFKTLRERKVYLRMAHLAPAAFIYLAALFLFPEPLPYKEDPFPYLTTFQNWHIIVSRFGLAYAAFICMLVVLTIVDAFDDIYAAEQPEDNPIEGISRTTKRLVTLVGFVLIFAALTGRNPMYFVGALGAFMAVIILVFRNSILGLVASVQIVTNRLVRLGDWIEVPKYGADGFVLKISLSCVKVQNFDKTIIVFPTYGLLSESFRNWSGMKLAGGRRIKRSIYIDMDSIQVCSPEMIQNFEQIELIRHYIHQKKTELEDYNQQRNVVASAINSRRLTNIGTLRAYLEAYLARHEALSGELTCLVRQLQPTNVGLPIEIYAFCTETAWVNYEAVQSDIFDHVLSVLPEFGLRAFQEITGSEKGGEQPPFAC